MVKFWVKNSRLWIWGAEIFWIPALCKFAVEIYRQTDRQARMH